MSNSDDFNEVGYRKPPKHTQFEKGKSGNPRGRPKGSQNLAIILDKIGRERVKVTENGGSRYISKLEASILQTYNKAVHGDLKAFRELLHLIQSLADSMHIAMPSPVTNENENAVMASMIERIRQSEDPPSNDGSDPKAAEPSR